MQLKAYKYTEIIALVVFGCLTLMAVQNKQVTVFYLIYVFWFDELIKTIFDALAQKKTAAIKLNKSVIRSRFFMLFIYLIFIVVYFGFIVDWSYSENILRNMEVLFFKNAFFNFTVIGFVFREIVNLYKNNVTSLITPRTIFSKGLITLHISIIFGVLGWFIASGKLGYFELNLEGYKSLIASIPFLIIKIGFEALEIKTRSQELSKTMV